MTDLNGHLDALVWSRARFAREADISIATANRIVAGDTVSRDVATKVLDTLSKAYGRKLTLNDVDGLVVSPTVKKKKEATRKTRARKADKA